MTLGEKQELFMESLGKLLAEMHRQGFKVRGGDLKAKPRNPLEHKSNSQHYASCAVDLNLFKGGVWLVKTEDHVPFGIFWESIHPMCRWGGHFQDGNHYEVKP